MMQSLLSINGTSRFEEIPQSTPKNTSQNVDGEIDQATPQVVIDSLKRYPVRKNGAYSTSDCICGICQRKFDIGNCIVCLPCQHNFHEYCIENWLKWVKPSCPLDKKSVIRTNCWNELENGRSKSKFLNISEEDDPTISSPNQNRTENKTSKETLKVPSNENCSPPEQALNNSGNYPILVSSLPILKRFSYFMNSKGPVSNRSMPLQNRTLPPSQKLQRNNKFSSPFANNTKFHKNSHASAFQKYFDTDNVSPNPTKPSSNDLPYNWIMSHPNREKDNRKMERFASSGEIKNSYSTEYNEEMTHTKVVVKRTVTFSNAFKQPGNENRGWIYKKRNGSSSRNLK